MMKPLFALLIALSLAFPVRADETQPPVADGAGLKLRFHGKLPERVTLTRVQGLIGSFLSGEEKERQIAEEEMVKTGPLVAFVAQERLNVEADAAVRSRLEAIVTRLQADSVASAKVIHQYAQALATLAKGKGPLDWDDPGLPRWRAMAKVFHMCYVNPEHYGTGLDKKLHIFDLQADLGAAVDLYTIAGDMYDRLAQAGAKSPDAAQCAAEAARCRDLAVRAKAELAAKVGGGGK